MIRKYLLTPLLLLLALGPAAPVLAQARPDAAALLAAQREALKALAASVSAASTWPSIKLRRPRSTSCNAAIASGHFSARRNARALRSFTIS